MQDGSSEGASRPFRPTTQQDQEVPRPPLPEDERPSLPRGLRKQLRRQVAEGIGDDVVLAMSMGAAAVQAERPDAAMTYLRWVKDKAPRVAEVREALGVAHYQLGEWREALSELRTYRRMTGRLDQNHLIADCRRALGGSSHEVAEEVEAMLAGDEVPAERCLEGVIVWASHLADEGNVDGGRAVLDRGRDLLTAAEDPETAARRRFRYVEGDLAARSGDVDAAREAFRSVLNAEGDSFDAADRLEEL